jgi:hypothetical protein
MVVNNRTLTLSLDARRSTSCCAIRVTAWRAMCLYSLIWSNTGKQRAAPSFQRLASFSMLMSYVLAEMRFVVLFGTKHMIHIHT